MTAAVKVKLMRDIRWSGFSLRTETANVDWNLLLIEKEYHSATCVIAYVSKNRILIHSIQQNVQSQEEVTLQEESQNLVQSRIHQ